MKKILIMILIALLTTQVQAIGSVNGKITKIRVDVTGKSMIFFDKPLAGTPATCTHSAYTTVLAVDAATEGGKAVLSMALTAKATGANVIAYGLGICGVYGGSVAETWNHGFIL